MFFTLTVLIAGTLILSASFTPLVIIGIEAVITQNHWPFSRIFNRVAMVAVVLMLVLLRNRIDFHKLKQSLSNSSPRVMTRSLLIGFLISAVSVVLTLSILVYLTEDLVWSSVDFNSLTLRILRYIIAALLIAFIEELFFRVLILQELKARMSFSMAAILTSLIYASVHFIAPVKTWQYQGEPYLEGFWYLFAVFSEFWQIKILLPLIGLFLVGMVLAIVMDRSKSLFYCVGLHAGWVLGVKLTRLITDPTGDSPLASIVGHLEQYHLVALVPAWLSVIAVGIVALWAIRLQRPTLPERMV